MTDRSPAKSDAKEETDIPAPPDIPEVTLYSDFAEKVTLISRTTGSLLLGTGKLGPDGDSVLLPYVDIKVRSAPLAPTDEEKTERVLTATVPFENAAYLLVDLTHDLRKICEQLSGLTQGSLAVEPARVAQGRYFIAHAAREAQRCLDLLDNSAQSAKESP